MRDMADHLSLNVIVPSLKSPEQAIPSLRLVVGEIIMARVLDVLADGLIRLNMKGMVLSAKTDIALPKEAVLNLKVVAADTETGELRLRLLGAEGVSRGALGSKLPSSSSVAAPVAKALAEFSRLVSRISDRSRTPSPPAELKETGSKDLPYEQSRSIRNAVAELVKALPEETAGLPRGLQVALRKALLEGIRLVGTEVPARHAQLVRTLGDTETSGGLNAAHLIDGSQLDDGKELLSQIRQALSDTGVSLEAKMRALAEATDDGIPERMTAGDAAEQTEISGKPAEGDIRRTDKGGTAGAGNEVLFEKDMKAQLLSVRERLVAQSTVPDSGDDMPGLQEGGQLARVERQLAGIETFQALSRLNDSFHTFLPFQWQELRDGDIVFKRKQTDSGEAFYCVVNLDLAEAGKANVMIAVVQKRLSVDIFLTNKEFKSLVDGRIDEVAQGMRSQGLHLERVTVSQSDESKTGKADPLNSAVQQINLKV